MKAYRAALLRFDSDGQAVYDTDGLLLTAPDPDGTQRVVASGAWGALRHLLDQPGASGADLKPSRRKQNLPTRPMRKAWPRCF
jgi:hypothetical protein